MNIIYDNGEYYDDVDYKGDCPHDEEAYFWDLFEPACIDPTKKSNFCYSKNVGQ